MKVLCMGETLLRYSTSKGSRFRDLDFKVHVGGSETNIAVNLAQYGFDVSLLTKLPEHALGDAIISFLRSFGVNTSTIVRGGERVGSYYLEIGSGNRTSQVIYDRKNSSMSTFTLNDICLETLFKDIDVFMVSGITPAVKPEVKDAMMSMLQYCKEHHIKVAYDNNYRAKMWSVEEAGKAFKEILPYVDILSAGLLDAKGFLGIESNCETFEEKMTDIYAQMKSMYPNLKYMTCTKRDIISSSVNDLTGYLYTDKLYTSKTYHIDDIVDRVGGGDAYIAGLLYGVLSGKEEAYSVEFASAASTLKHSVHGDANLFNVNEIETFMNAGVSRINR